MHLDPNGECYSDGGNPNFRARDLMALLEPIARYLPEATEFTVSTHDLGSTIIGEDQRLFLEEKIAAGEYATEEELKPYENGHRHKDKGVDGTTVSIPCSSECIQLILECLSRRQSWLAGSCCRF